MFSLVTRIVQMLLIPLLLLSSITLASAQSPTLTVAGAPAVNIRSCAELDCDIVAVADLGEEVTSTGETENGFTPVQFGNVTGYAFSLYLIGPDDDLWFTEGLPGCDRIALIFDIGIGYTPSQTILDTLEETDTIATMFPMGIFAEDQPEYLEQMYDLGFPIGTHGQDAILLTDETAEVIADDVSMSLETIGAVIETDPEPLFTPYAADTDALVRSVVAGLGILPVGWNVAAVDYAADATADGVYNDVVENVYDGAIVEMHLDGPATEESTAAALPSIIADLTDQGYTFVSVSDMTLPCGESATT